VNTKFYGGSVYSNSFDSDLDPRDSDLKPLDSD